MMNLSQGFLLAVVVFILAQHGSYADFNGRRGANLRRRRRDADDAKAWGYRNADISLLPDDWYKSYPKCYGSRQSPIDIVSKSTVFNSALTKLSISQVRKNGVSGENWQVKNNGHSGRFEMQ
jgi:hypothetical protein